MRAVEEEIQTNVEKEMNKRKESGLRGARPSARDALADEFPDRDDASEGAEQQPSPRDVAVELRTDRDEHRQFTGEDRPEPDEHIVDHEAGERRAVGAADEGDPIGIDAGVLDQR